MPRARSGSFYCPLEPAASQLSLSQKAAISTAHPLHSSSSASSSSPASSSDASRPFRRHTRTPSFDGAVSLSAPTSVTLPPAKLSSNIPLSARPELFSHSPKRHSWSPRQPSPLRRQANSPGPMCPSALWTTHAELLPLSCSAPSSSAPLLYQRKPRPLRQSVLKNAFLSSPMGEKASMYGLRVAWCVWGDVKDILAKEIYRPKYAPRNSDEEPEHRENVNVDDRDALSPPPPPSTLRRSGLRRENSFVWEEHAPVITAEELDSAQPLPVLDLDLNHIEYSHQFDEETSSDSDYSDDEGDTESDELDLSDIELGLEDEEEVERDIAQLLSGVSLTQEKVSVHERWDVLSLRI